MQVLGKHCNTFLAAVATLSEINPVEPLLSSEDFTEIVLVFKSIVIPSQIKG